MNAYRGPPMTLGNAADAKVRLIVWCRDCGRQVEPDPVEMAERYGAETTVADWQLGSFAPAAAAVRSISSSRERNGGRLSVRT
jgi:hypothetical protein